MKTINTILGEVEVTDARIVRANGYGQYSIRIDFEFEGTKKAIRIHSTDSRLFDAAHGEDNHAEIVLEKAASIIERAIEEYINSL